MTREEAIKTLATINKAYANDASYELGKKAINVLKQPAPADDAETFTVIYIEDDEEVSFVNMVNARLPVVEECFEAIRTDFTEFFEQGSGEYTIKIGSYNEAQIGEYGRVEIAPWWNMDVIAFEPIDTQSKEATDEFS